jgi:phosphoglycolate phosphatase
VSLSTRQQLLVFDLDGTLIDSAEDLAISMNATRGHFGLAPLNAQVIYSYVGNGAAVLVRRALDGDVPESAHAEALAFFLRFYREHALEHTKLYPGIRESLDGLAERGFHMAVLTNKPVRISTDIVKALGVAPRFARVYGGDSFPVKKPDPAGLRRIAEELEIPIGASTMIGDSAVDVETARNAPARSVGVLWGFQPESVRAAAPDALVEQPEELLRLFMPD